MDFSQYTDQQLVEAIAFYRRQRNTAMGLNEAAHSRAKSIIRLAEQEQARRLEEKKLTAKDVKQALASAKAKPKETVSLKKPPFKMEEVDLDESRQLLAARKSAERAADQKVRVDKKTYDWGKMVTVHDGIRKSFPLHPEHQEKIKNLKHGESTTFTDETRNKVKAHREGDTVHLQRADSDKKTSVPYSHFAESVDLDEAESYTHRVGGYYTHRGDDKPVSIKVNASSEKEAKEKASAQLSGNHKNYRPTMVKQLTNEDLDEAKKPKPGHNASVMAKNISKVLAAVKKEEVALDEVSASTLGSYIRKASKNADASMQKRYDAIDNDDRETARKMGRLARKREKGADMAMDKLKGTSYAKVHATEEVDLDEAADLRVTKVYNKWPKKATYAVHNADRSYHKEFDSMEAAKAHHAEKSGK